MLTTTLREIRSHSPCSDDKDKGWPLLLRNLNAIDVDGNIDLDRKVTIEEILNSNGIEDACWALRCWAWEYWAEYAVDVAESVLYIFENKHPDDKRPKAFIEGIRQYLKGGITLEELTILRISLNTSIADATKDVKDTNINDYDDYDDNEIAASWTAVAVADAVNAATTASAFSTAIHAVASVTAAAWAAAWTASTASTFISISVKRKQWEKNEELMRKWIERTK